MIYLLILISVIVVGVALVIRQRRQNKPVIEHNPFNTVAYLQTSFESGENASESELSPPKQGMLPYNVLIVDDQPAIRLLLRELFELEGVTVYEAPNGRTAIQQVRRNRVDFILLDLKMPDMDGIEALREIRTFNSSVQVAMITAYGDPEKLETAKKLGTLAFFTKPFDIEYVKDFVMVRLKQEAEQGRAGDVS